MRGGEQHRQGAALSNRDQRRLLGTRRIEHRSNIIDLLLQRRRPGNPAGHPRATPVELNQPREGRQLPEKARPGRQLPIELDIREERGHHHDVEPPLANHLIGDLHITATRVPRE